MCDLISEMFFVALFAMFIIVTGQLRKEFVDCRKLWMKEGSSLIKWRPSMMSYINIFLAQCEL